MRNPRGNGGSKSVDTESINELVMLYCKQQEAALRCSDAIKAAADKAGLMAPVVRRFVKAVAEDKLEEEKHATEQLSLLLEFGMSESMTPLAGRRSSMTELLL